MSSNSSSNEGFDAAKGFNFICQYALSCFLWCIFVVGAFIRIRAYFLKHSLFIDEANVARNVYEKSYTQLFGNLNYEQYIPPIFGVFNKLACNIIGYSELGLRFVPLIASLLVYFLLYKVLKKQKISNFVISFVFWAYSFSYISIMHGVVLKQYCTDLVVALSIILLSFVNWKIHKPIIQVVFLSIVGAFFIWISMPSIFGLAALGSLPILNDFRNKTLQNTKIWIFPIVFWIANFGVYYFCILKSDANSDYLQQYHQSYFLPLMATSMQDLQQIWKIYKGIIIEYFMSASNAYYIVPFWLLGMMALLKQKSHFAYMLIVPLLGTLFASMLQQYSLIPRLLFFLIPAIFVPLAYGLETIYIFLVAKKMNKIIAMLPIIFLSYVFLQPINQHRFWKQKFCVEMTKDALLEMNKLVDKTDGLIVHTDAFPAYTYYINYHPSKAIYKQTNSFYAHKWNNNLVNLSDSLLQHHSKVWVLFGHSPNEEIDENIAKLEKHFIVNHKNRHWRAGYISLQRQ